MIASLAYPNENLDVYKRQGQALGHNNTARLELSPLELESITPEELRGKKFDGENAYSQVIGTSYQHFDNLDKNIDLNVQVMLENSEQLNVDKISINPEKTESVTIEKCLFESILTPITLYHTLTVQVTHTPAITKKTKVCKGHHSEDKSDHTADDIRKMERKFKSDPSIKTYRVQSKDRGIGHRNLVICDWTHVDDAGPCQCFREEEQVIKPEKWEEVDLWQMEKPELLDSLDCKLISIENGVQETKIIEGREITRPYWTKSHHLQCVKQQQINCNFLSDKMCILHAELCIKLIGNQCMTWEKHFKCVSRKPSIGLELTEMYGTDAQTWEITPYQPNQDLPNVATKLAVFDEMKKELQNSRAPDVRSVRLFKGISQKCSKSIADDLLYDCCFDMDGFSTQIKLSKCTADEIALAESRRKGLCHHLGVKKESFLGMWTSRKEHVFCVFPTKLSRVFQEEARKQLGIGWGDAENPDCRGLTQEEIKKLDFSKLNLLEAFEAPKGVENNEKVKKIEERLKKRLEEM